MDTIVPTPATIRQIAQFITLLESCGIAGNEIQRFIDDIGYRASVVQAMREETGPLVDISGEFNQGAVDGLIAHLLTLQHLNSEHALRRLGYDPFEVLATTTAVKALMVGLTPLQVAVVVLRSGLLDGVGLPPREVAERLGMSMGAVSQARGAATKHMMHRRAELYPSKPRAPHLPSVVPVAVMPLNLTEASPIEDMCLTVRQYNCLKRVDIHTVGDLTAKSRDDLLDIRNLGANLIEDLEDKLAKLGLGLSENLFSH